jgi:hypothetical protein
MGSLTAFSLRLVCCCQGLDIRGPQFVRRGRYGVGLLYAIHSKHPPRAIAAQASQNHASRRASVASWSVPGPR